MINYADRQLPLADRLEIVWWRLVVLATRLLVRARGQLPMWRATQLLGTLAPIRGYLWIPVASGLAGALLGLFFVIVL
jgi:hypothetical protein